MGFRRIVFGAGLLILAFAAFMIGANVVHAGRSMRLAVTGHVAAGKVVDVKVVETGANDAAIYPIIEFTSQDGRRQRFTADLSGLNIPNGGAVNVRYDENAPENAAIDSFGGLLGASLVRIAFAIFPLGLLGAVMVWFTRSRPSDADLLRDRQPWVPGWFPP